MPNFGIKIEKSFGGRSNAYKFSNNYNVSSDYTLADPNLRAAVIAMVNAERTAHLAVVHFLRATVSPLRSQPGKAKPNDFVSMELAGTGERAVTSQIAPDNMVLQIRREAVTGKSGLVAYRGCLQFSDIASTEDHSFNLVDRSVFETGGIGNDTLIEKLNAPPGGVTFIMPNSEKNLVDVDRNVTAHRLIGIGFRQATNPRRTAVAEMSDGAQRRVNELAGSVIETIAGGTVMALSPAYRLFVQTSVLQIKEILEALPPEKAMKIAVDQSVKALMGADF
jgi:hypothetical protein